MIKYIPVDYVGRIIKLDDTTSTAKTLKSVPSAIDYCYLADEDGVLVLENKEKTVNKGDLILCLYGSIVDGKYTQDGRTHVIISKQTLDEYNWRMDGVAEWTMLVNMKYASDITYNKEIDRLKSIKTSTMNATNTSCDVSC